MPTPWKRRVDRKVEDRQDSWRDSKSRGGAALGGIACSEAGAGAVACIAVGGAVGGITGSLTGATVAQYLCKPAQQSIFIVISER